MLQGVIMTIKYTVIDVAEDTQRELWQVTYETADGQRHAHHFPKATLEWRAAEYGLDDPAEILEVILHEPHVPREPAGAPVSLTSTTARAVAAKPRVTLYTATTTGQARDAHRELISQVKAEHVRIEAPAKGPDPLDVIRARHGITPEGRRAKAMAVDINRWKHLYGGLPVPIEEVPRA
ncbi:hypothetical protein J1792_16080 [Streptomyces triculaminicus]|uniref:Uncharacterized protein n=1 Tax=Streptomyces triculaminicus TaxID=2816232 RepID=A0A939FQQ0_9ACTN|nr:hypothetical protein [Streptomyces triculaminicus]MBO0654235.1 hypothetical protein [Streptomyces triculaminicus]